MNIFDEIYDALHNYTILHSRSDGPGAFTATLAKPDAVYLHPEVFNELRAQDRFNYQHFLKCNGMSTWTFCECPVRLSSDVQRFAFGEPVFDE